MTFTKEQLTKAKQAKSAEELLAMAKAENVEMTAEEAAKYFAELHKEGELSDSELASVAGGTKDPQEYYTKSTWSAEGCNCNSFWSNTPNVSKKCGNCCHFRENSRNSPDGVCRREFEE